MKKFNILLLFTLMILLLTIISYADRATLTLDGYDILNSHLNTVPGLFNSAFESGVLDLSGDGTAIGYAKGVTGNYSIPPRSADLNGDNNDELFITTNNIIRLYEYSGSLKTFLLKDTHTYSEQILATWIVDLNGDGVLELLINVEDKLYFYGYDGTNFFDKGFFNSSGIFYESFLDHPETDGVYDSYAQFLGMTGSNAHIDTQFIVEGQRTGEIERLAFTMGTSAGTPEIVNNIYDFYICEYPINHFNDTSNNKSNLCLTTPTLLAPAFNLSDEWGTVSLGEIRYVDITPFNMTANKTYTIWVELVSPVPSSPGADIYTVLADSNPSNTIYRTYFDDVWQAEESSLISVALIGQDIQTELDVTTSGTTPPKVYCSDITAPSQCVQFQDNSNNLEVRSINYDGAGSWNTLFTPAEIFASPGLAVDYCQNSDDEFIHLDLDNDGEGRNFVFSLNAWNKKTTSSWEPHSLVFALSDNLTTELWFYEDNLGSTWSTFTGSPCLHTTGVLGEDVLHLVSSPIAWAWQDVSGESYFDVLFAQRERVDVDTNKIVFISLDGRDGSITNTQPSYSGYTDVVGEAMSNPFVGTYFADQDNGNREICWLVYDDQAPGIKPVCWADSRDNCFTNSGFDEGDVEDIGAGNYDWLKYKGAFRVHNIQTNPVSTEDEMLTPWGIKHYDSSCGVFCGHKCNSLENEFTFGYDEVFYYHIDYEGIGLADIIAQGSDRVVYIDDGTTNTQATIPSGGVIINPCVDQLWKLGTTVTVEVQVNDAEGDLVQVKIIMYDGETFQQISDWSSFQNSGNTFTSYFVANETCLNCDIFIQARDDRGEHQDNPTEMTVTFIGSSATGVIESDDCVSVIDTGSIVSEEDIAGEEAISDMELSIKDELSSLPQGAFWSSIIGIELLAWIVIFAFMFGVFMKTHSPFMTGIAGVVGLIIGVITGLISVLFIVLLALGLIGYAVYKVFGNR